MMRLWRISNHASLSGDGGLYASGRWHTRGRRVVYLADHPASALLEVMVHLEIDAEDLPTHYQLLGVEVPDGLRQRCGRRERPDRRLGASELRTLACAAMNGCGTASDCVAARAICDRA